MPAGANTFRHVYVKDLRNGKVTRVSDSFGTTGDGNGESAAISPDGKLVDYVSTASNLYPLDTNGNRPDVFVTNILTGQASIISRNDEGQRGNGYTINVAWLGDSKHPVFPSLADNLVPDDKNRAWALFQVSFR